MTLKSVNLGIVAGTKKCEDCNKEKIYNQGDDMQSWQIFNLGLMALIVLVAKMALYDPLCLT